VDTRQIVRGGVGVAAGVLLLAIGVVSWTMPVSGTVYGRVEASQSWLVTFEQGRVGTRFSQGNGALGPEIGSMEMFAFDRVGKLSLERLAQPGAQVAAGQAVARVASDLGPDRVVSLQATVDELKARRALLLAGGRKEAVVRAEKEVQVAESNRDLVKQQLDREQQLAASGASSASVVADLRTRDEALAGIVSAKQAALEDVRRPARPEQIAEIDARILAAEADVRVAQAGGGARDLVSPIAGSVIRGELPCDPLDPVCAPASQAPAMLQVVVSDPVVVRVPWPGTVPPAVGASLDLEMPSRETVSVQVADVGPIQRDRQGLPYVPISAVVPNEGGKLTVGSLVIVRPARSWLGFL
jgi:hypothetical protein